MGSAHWNNRRPVYIIMVLFACFEECVSSAVLKHAHHVAKNVIHGAGSRLGNCVIIGLALND